MKCGVWHKSFAKCVSGRLCLPPQRSGVSLSASAMKHFQIVGKCGALNNYTYARFCQQMAMMMEFRADSSGRRKIRSCWDRLSLAAARRFYVSYSSPPVAPSSQSTVSSQHHGVVLPLELHVTQRILKRDDRIRIIRRAIDLAIEQKTRSSIAGNISTEGMEVEVERPSPLVGAISQVHLSMDLI